MPMENIVNRLHNWAFVSNGILSADKRIVDNTNRIEKLEELPDPELCLFEKYRLSEERMKDKKRSWRIADLANYIQLVLLFLVVYGMFFQWTTNKQTNSLYPI